MKAFATATFCVLLVAISQVAGAAGSPPIVTLTPGEAVFYIGKGPIVVDPGAAVDDLDSPNAITSAPPDGTSEALAVVDNAGLTATYDPAQALLTLSGLASIDVYDTALESITYHNTKASPTKTPGRVLEYRALDADGNVSAVTTRTVEVAALVHYYTFNGNWNDSAGAWNLSITTAGTGGVYLPTLTPGPFTDGGAITRTNVTHVPGGATNYQYLKSGTVSLQNHYTTVLWANSDAPADQGTNRGIYSNGPNNNSAFQFDSNNGKYRRAGGVVGAVAMKNVTAGKWTHLCETWDGAVTKTYFDGVLFKTSAGNGGDKFVRVSLGSNRANNNGFAGYVDDVGIFDYALSDQLIAATYALGKFHGRNLDSTDIDAFLAAFHAGPGGSITLDGSLWLYATVASLKAGTTVGTTGGSLAGKDAYVVLDASGCGMRVSSPPVFDPLPNVALVVGQPHPSTTLGFAWNPSGVTSALTASASSASPLVVQNVRVWGSGNVTADVDATGPGVHIGLAVPVVVTVSNGPMDTSGTVTITIVAAPNPPPVFITTGTVTGAIGQSVSAPGIATIQDDAAVTSVGIVYQPPQVQATISAITPPVPSATVSVSLDITLGAMMAPGTYPIRLIAYDAGGASIGTVALNAVCEPSTGTPTGDAQQILAATSVTGGLIVHLGCGAGQLTAALGQYSKCIVQGLDTDSLNVDQVRQTIDSLGLYGRVTAKTWSGGALPYIDNTVNLIVAEQLTGLDADELMRVLVPNGVAYLKVGDTWNKYDKPRPDWLDDWTHYMYDSSNNMVSHDKAVQLLKRMQWISEPAWSRHHDHKSAYNGGVSANGRIFSFIDMGARQSILLPDHMALVAQDAFNGAELWRTYVSKWHNPVWPLKSGPFQLTRRLIAIGDKVYATLGTDAPLSCIDAATGNIIRTYPNSTTTEEVLYRDGILYMQVNDSPSSYTYPTLADIKTAADQAWWSGQTRWITAVNADTGAQLWRVQRPVAPASLAVNDQGVFFYDGQRVIRLDKTDGNHQIWQSDPLPCVSPILSEEGLRVVLYQNVVLYCQNDYAGTANMYGLSMDDGHTLWSAPHPPSNHHSPQDLMGIDGLVWTGDTAQGNGTGVWTGRDPLTGNVVRTFGPDITINYMHHRCYLARATDDYLLTSRDGIEFTDVRPPYHLTTHHWTRGACIYGIIPANGLIYSTPHPCACFMEAKLPEFYALAPDNSGTTINHAPNSVANSTFETTETLWQWLPVGSGNALCEQTENNGAMAWLRLTGDSQTGHIRQSLSLVAGTRYYVAFDLPYWGQQPNLTGQFLVDLGGDVQALAAVNGRVEGALVAGSSGYLEITPVGNAGQIAMLDNVAVRRMAHLSGIGGSGSAPQQIPAQLVSNGSRLAARSAPRLELGPAYQDKSYRSYESYGSNQLAPSPDQGEWPTYRHDTLRSACASTSVSTDLRLAWRRTLGGQLTALTVAGGKVLVAAVETHTVYALDAADGHIVWEYMAGGRVDSPPTIDGDKVYFGCHDGWIYCLSLSDGQLVWRYRAAPDDTQLVARNQLESVWPVKGSVLVTGGAVYSVAGRSMFLDGGLHFVRLDARTGQLQLERVLDDRDPASGQNLQMYVSGQNMVVALPDILSYDGNYIYMRSSPMDKNGIRQYLPYSAHPVTDQIGPYIHLFASTAGGFLDDTWFHRTEWVYGQSTASSAGGYYLAGQNTPGGRMLAFTPNAVYGFGRNPNYYKWTTPMEFRYFRAPLPRTIVPKSGNNLQTFGVDWVTTPSILARAMVLTTNTVFFAGPQDVLDEEVAINNLQDTVIQSEMVAQEAALSGQSGAKLVALSTANGAVAAQLPLSEAPVFDGMAAAYGNLFYSTLNGNVICLKPPVFSSLIRSWTLY